MENAQIIYQQTILSLPDSEKLRLASIILQNLTRSEAATQSAYDLLQNLPENRAFSTAQKADEYLKAERDSWDN